VKIQVPRLADAPARALDVGRRISRLIPAGWDVFEIPVDLVGRREEQRRRIVQCANNLEEIECARALISKSAMGSMRLVVTATCAAKWKTRWSVSTVTISKHLQVLFNAGLVQRRRSAGAVIYWLSSTELVE
jgi:hypothetical protein